MTTTLVINGQQFEVNLATLPPDISLNTFIREHAQLTATKFMCLEGGCGACICVIKDKHPVTGEMRTWAANSCLTLLNTCIDSEIVTAEGIGSKRSGYHPIQKRLAKMNGSQCGFCSPGFVMNMYALLESKGGKVTMDEVENSFGGNICRCTGYRPILDAMKSFAVDSVIDIPSECRDIEDLSERKCPKSGQLCSGLCHKPLNVLTYENGTQWHWPKTLNDLFDALNKVSDSEKYMLVAGNTAHGVYRRPLDITHFIDVNAIPDLKRHTISNGKLILGANLSLSEAMDIFLETAKTPGFEYCQQLWQHFDLIANVPVRNNGTIAGNIMIKKMHPEFPSDVFICFEGLNVQVVINESPTVQKSVSLSDYMKTTTHKVIITSFELKEYPKDRFVYKSYKVMPRAQNAHAYVNAAFLLDMDRVSGNVNLARICFGGIKPEFVHDEAVEAMIKGKVIYEKELLSQMFTQMSNTLEPDSILPDASPEYRMKLACGLLYKFLLSIAPPEKIKEEYKSGDSILKRPLSSGSQSFGTNKKMYPVTQPVEKIEAMIQCSGEATYMNDTLTKANSLYCAFVSAVKVGATIESTDATEALNMPGVVAFYSAKDIPGSNTFVDPVFSYEKEEIFCSNIVKYYDQPLGIIVATTNDITQRAISKVKVIYAFEDSDISQSLKDTLQYQELSASSQLTSIKLKDAPGVSGKGLLDLGLQYHFTLEPQTTVVIPLEEGLQVYSATQWIDHTQCVIAKMLQLKINDVQLKVRRLGGAYGYKITRGNQVACAASLAAYKLNRPVRFVQTIESMMNCIGKRWGSRSEYEFHVKSNGEIIHLNNVYYEDAGCSMNENVLRLETFRNFRNCYLFTDINLKLDGHVVTTDAPSNTWCRAPASLQGVSMIENIMDHIAFETNTDPADVRLANIAQGHRMNELLPNFIKSTEYKVRRQEIEDYNKHNRWRKRGIGLAIVDYPIAYEGIYPATVSIYHCDGTVVISHSGIEMGQGLNTKVAQVAALILRIPLEIVKIETTNSINGANARATDSSIGSEGVCYAVRKACTTLNDRLQPIKDSLKKDATWQEIVQEAWNKSTNMIASEHFKPDDMEPYNIYGLAVTEVEVDILTGNNLIRRVDILEDAGESLSPNIDIGQVEGAFVMCLGYWLSEQLVYDRQTGQLLTNRTWNYKPPGAKDIPIDFRIELLQNSSNHGGFLRSKATGEPPCCLSISALFAIQQAIQSARNDAGLKREWVRLGAPTTPETILLNVGCDVQTYSLK